MPSILAVLGVLLLSSAPGGALAAELEVGDAWVREPPPGTMLAAGFMHLHNPGEAPVVILGVDSPCCQEVRIHQSLVENGVARMRPVERLEIPPGGDLELAPGGYHLMLIAPRTMLTSGRHVTLLLKLGDGTTRTVRAEVRRDTGATDHAHHHP